MSQQFSETDIGDGYAKASIGVQVFPAFLVLDTSGSMSMGGRLDAASDMVPAILDECMQNTAVAGKLRLEVLEFNSAAHVLVPLGTVDQVGDAPTLQARGLTSYGSAFSLLRSQIESAVRSLKADGYTVLRPTVFFVTDGEPTDDEDDRDAAFASLTDPGFRAGPNICMFGVGEAEDDVLLKYKSRHGVAVKGKGDAASALRGLIPVITRSIVTSTTSPDGVFSIDPDDLTNDDDDLFDVLG